MRKSTAPPKLKTFLRPPISYYGGKQLLLSKILPLIPEHEKYIECFLGGGAVFWAKEPSKIEIINDMDGFVNNFYSAIKTDFNGIESLIKSHPHGRRSHDQASVMRQYPELFSSTQRAWAFFYLANTSMYAMLDSQQVCPGKDNKPPKTYHNKVGRFDDSYYERLKNVYVESRDALYVIRAHDADNAFLFIDPPYYNSDMGHYGGYTKEDYIALLTQLESVKGKFLLTCYPSDVIDKFIERNGWTVDRHEMALNAGSKGKKKVEVIVRNY
jgi:DNA adenine methylase